MSHSGKQAARGSVLWHDTVYCMDALSVISWLYSANMSFFLHLKKPGDVGDKCNMQSTVWKPAAPKGSNPVSYPPPTARNLLHQQGLSALQIEAQRLSAWEQISLSSCSTSSILSRDFIVLSRRRITPDSLLTGMLQNVCVCSQKRCRQCKELKNVYLNSSSIWKSYSMSMFHLSCKSPHFQAILIVLSFV